LRWRHDRTTRWRPVLVGLVLIVAGGAFLVVRLVGEARPSREYHEVVRVWSPEVVLSLDRRSERD